jgi:hypothetical protein
MTEPAPIAPVPAPAQLPRLRQVEHPDLAPFLTHLCGRARPAPPSVPQTIRELTSERRLEDILWQARIRGFQPYSGGDPTVCLTESTVKGLEFLIGRRGYAPWGLVFDRQTV